LKGWLYTGMSVYGTLITMFIHADCKSHDFVSLGLSTPRMSQII